VVTDILQSSDYDDNGSYYFLFFFSVGEKQDGRYDQSDVRA
jgi:hypothetical protein